MGCGGTKAAPLHQNGDNNIPQNRPKFAETNGVDVGMVIPEKGASQIKPVEISVETLQKYLDLEKEIQRFEKRHVLDNYQLKTDQLEQLEKTVQVLEDSKNLQAQNLHQLQAALDTTNGSQSLKKFLFEKNQNGKTLNEDEEEYVDLLNRQEVTERQLATTRKQRDLLKEELSALAIDGELLQKLYAQRDELLDSIFGGQYGSERENRLEKEYDLLQERKNHIDQAHFKWKQAEIMIKQACAQLGLAVQKWKELLEIPENDMEQRYYHAAETRNNLVAASQNLQGAHGFLPNITFPYCAEDEVDTLNKAVTFIFTDMQTPERYEHALNCYHTTYRRSGALRQWFDQNWNTSCNAVLKVDHSLQNFLDGSQKPVTFILSVTFLFGSNEKCRLINHKLWGMGNICGDGYVSDDATPEPEDIKSTNRRRRETNEKYPGIHYFEENRLQDEVFRGKDLDKSEPKCSCFGPTPEERFFIQRCPHPQVLNTTISKDLAEITEESKAKAQELRQERIHLIKRKVKDITGKDVDFDTRSLDTDAEEIAADEQVAKLFEAERLDGKSQNLLRATSTLPLAPTPVPVSDLAPIPTNEEIFGKIDELRKKHAVEMADFEKAQTMNKARTTQGLQEKLQARRSRRSRMQNHEREIEELQSALR